MIIQTLYQQGIKHHVNFFDEHHLLDILFSDDGRACGVVTLEMRTGEFHTIHAKAVLIATGGFGRVFKITSNAMAGTGDGVAIAFRRGVPLMDMEFYQFHPTGHLQARHPPLGSGPRRGRHPPQRRGRGLRRALRADAEGPGAARHGLPLHLPGDQGRPRDRRQGLCPPRSDPPADGGHRRETAGHHRLRPHLPRRRAEDATRADPADRPLRDGRHSRPTSRAGCLRDADGNDHPGLYSAGETACVSVHGANRLGTNSLVDLVVFGRRAGRHMLEFDRRDAICRRCRPIRSSWPAPRSPTCSSRPKGERVADIRARDAGR